MRPTKSASTTPCQNILVEAPQEMEGCLIRNVWVHVIQALFLDLHLPPNDIDSCLPQLLQQPLVLFKESS